MCWFGADPGGLRKGKAAFGVAALHADGTFESQCVNSAHAAFDWIRSTHLPIRYLGIDCPMWWSSGPSGGRQVDANLRRHYGSKVRNSIMQLNSLQGAALVQGIMLAKLARDDDPSVRITETHPKALLKAMGLISDKRYSSADWRAIVDKFQLSGNEPPTFDEVDALVAAVCAREFYTGKWTQNLSTMPISHYEIEPSAMFFGSVDYGWFEPVRMN